MASHISRQDKNEIYFVTFSCFQWLPLIEKSNSYEYIDRWFQYLNENLCKILGFVIMPNHFHGIFYVESKCKYTLNTIVSNGKRFWTYEMVRNLALSIRVSRRGL